LSSSGQVFVEHGTQEFAASGVANAPGMRPAEGPMKGTNMNKLLVTLLGTAFLAGCAYTTGGPPSQAAATSDGYYWWLHPKLGMVKVDRATNAMLVSQTPSR
jgi:hypothetical protein